MKQFIIPKGYVSPQSIKDTEIAIKEVKDFFERELAKQLSLTRVSAPLFVKPESGLNDRLNGVERPVEFGIKEQQGRLVEIVQSLAKWKRMALKRYQFQKGEGLYTDMTAIRRDEETDNIHSIYVDQWDWEKIIQKEERNIYTLQEAVRKVYKAMKETEKYMVGKLQLKEQLLTEDIFFITSQELEDLYPNDTPKQREYKITKQKGSVFLMQIGDYLKSGQKHDGRAPDYDDWTLNGDILVYYPVLDMAMELSSMGIRVDKNSLEKQLKICDCMDYANLPFQQALLNEELPFTIGGGIGQSRICMFILRRAHIGEVQASIWPELIIENARKRGIHFL